MKIAVLGDIHGNFEALQAVLADMDAVRPERVFCTGDIVGYGADPRECLQVVRERGWPTVIGNWELVVAPGGTVSPDEFNPFAKASAYWTRGVLTDDDRQYLGKLPESICQDGIQVVHGFPGEGKATRYLIRLEDAADGFAAAAAPTVFLGHTHLPITFLGTQPVTFTAQAQFQLAGGTRAIVNTGSVGQPRDGDARASYAVYDTEARAVQVRRVAYDIDRAARKIVEVGLPDVIARRLSLGK